MEDFDSNDPRDQALWRLLGRARTCEASPYFARRVRRAVEAQPEKSAWWQTFLRLVAPAAVCAGIAVAAMTGVGRPNSSAVLANTGEIEFETIANLDLMVSTYESSLWLDSSASPY